MLADNVEPGASGPVRSAGVVPKPTSKTALIRFLRNVGPGYELWLVRSHITQVGDQEPTILDEPPLFRRVHRVQTNAVVFHGPSGRTNRPDHDDRGVWHWFNHQDDTYAFTNASWSCTSMSSPDGRGVKDGIRLEYFYPLVKATDVHRPGLTYGELIAAAEGMPLEFANGFFDGKQFALAGLRPPLHSFDAEHGLWANGFRSGYRAYCKYADLEAWLAERRSAGFGIYRPQSA